MATLTGWDLQSLKKWNLFIFEPPHISEVGTRGEIILFCLHLFIYSTFRRVPILEN
ncbi:hypothetical protein C0J52_11127 [Blattella germanica]|nr:hypothetical protein C0J52_11127 [Blattella germanica]